MAAALEPRPRPSGMRLTQVIRAFIGAFHASSPSAQARAMRFVWSVGSPPAPSPAIRTSQRSAGSKVASFSSESASPNASNPGPMLDVVAGARTTVKHTDMQDALRSFIGLQMSTSGCPAFDRLRPLARFHLPFASPEETLWRVAGSFAVDAFHRGLNRAQWWAELREQYTQLGAMNRAFCQRLRARLPGDAGVNAMVNLFSLSMCVKDELEDEVTALAMLLGASTTAPTTAADAALSGPAASAQT